MPDFKVGDSVIVTEGPFADFRATIEYIDFAYDTIRLAVSVFDRMTPVEVRLDQVRRPMTP